MRPFNDCRTRQQAHLLNFAHGLISFFFLFLLLKPIFTFPQIPNPDVFEMTTSLFVPSNTLSRGAKQYLYYYADT